MRNYLMPALKQQFFDSNGDVLTSGYIAFYSPGTTNYKDVYSAYDGSTPKTNPVALDSSGMVEVWLHGFYDIAVYDGVDAVPESGDYGTLLYTISNVSPTSFVYSTANVTVPPTDAELDAAFGTPADLGSGFIGIINDNNSDTTVYICITIGSKWFYTAALTAAV